jgi:hypothetical protein
VAVLCIKATTPQDLHWIEQRVLCLSPEAAAAAAAAATAARMQGPAAPAAMIGEAAAVAVAPSDTMNTSRRQGVSLQTADSSSSSSSSSSSCASITHATTLLRSSGVVQSALHSAWLRFGDG